MTGTKTDIIRPSRGKRESNKALKLQKIKEAARSFFIEKGFDEATTREIACRAGVAMGTVYLYADNKRDLLFLIANDDLTAVNGSALTKSSDVKDPIDALTTIFGEHYTYFAKQPNLSRAMLREMTFYDSGKQGLIFQNVRKTLIDQINAVFLKAQEIGKVRRDTSADKLGWLAFCVYQVELRHWMMHEELTKEDGIRRLRQALEILFAGLAPRASKQRSKK